MYSRFSLILRNWTMPVLFAYPITLAHNEKSLLESIVRAHATPQGLAFRCQAILRAAAPDHLSNLQVANALQGNRHTMGRWRSRYLAFFAQGPYNTPRPGR